jgi:hypothetical protein
VFSAHQTSNFSVPAINRFVLELQIHCVLPEIRSQFLALFRRIQWTTPDSRNTPSATNLEEEEIVVAPGNNGSASMPEQVKRPKSWKKMMMTMI